MVLSTVQPMPAAASLLRAGHAVAPRGACAVPCRSRGRSGAAAGI